jgi:hypothetical protein
MSYTTALGVTPCRRPVELATFHNSHGWSPSIWSRLLGERWWSDDAGLNRLWRSVEELPEWKQAAVVLTFDTGVIPHQAFEWAADHLDEFERRLPSPAGYVNHVPAVAELLRSKPDAPLFGVWGTSVSENPFDPWNEEADEPGSGIPLYPPLVGESGHCGMYVLERHRHFLPAFVS